MTSLGMFCRDALVVVQTTQRLSPA
jgi:hypothetical protein